MSKSVFLFSVVSLIVLSLAVAAFALSRPVAHWDVITYVASAFKSLGLSGQELHEKTYEVIKNAYDPAIFGILAGSPEASGHGEYRYTIFSDPIALEQQLPFYRIRVAYIFLLNILAPVTGGLVGAAQIISAFSAGLITLVTGWALMQGPRALPPLLALGIVPVLVAGAGVIGAGQMETPDALASLVALLALLLMHSNRLVAFVLLVLLVLIRTDGVLLTGLAVILLLAERETRVRYYLLAGLSVALYFFVNHHYGNYGHLTLFNFTLMNDAPDPYPATMALETDVVAYVKIYVFALIRFAPTLLLPGVILLVIAADIRRNRHVTPLTARAIIAVVFLAGHFLLFPLGSDRHYVFSIVFASVYAAQTLFGWATRDEAA
ncbi:hypothetical protein ACOTTU_21840 [Roseobacter sp. EG26]|uniref:hypothetical protein n=1 Tax=Roseobacter sp. EG26 TaxID=3412477 RepID=UPI003CE59205